MYDKNYSDDTVITLNPHENLEVQEVFLESQPNSSTVGSQFFDDTGDIDDDRQQLLDDITEDDTVSRENRADHISYANDDVRNSIQKLTQMWCTECSIPETTSSFFTQVEGDIISRAMQEADIALQALDPQVDSYQRLSLCLNERALRRMCQIIRMYKAKRLAKLLLDPSPSIMWYNGIKALLDGQSVEDQINKESLSLPLEEEEYIQACKLELELERFNVKCPPLDPSPNVLHFEVSCPHLTLQNIIENAKFHSRDELDSIGESSIQKEQDMRKLCETLSQCQLGQRSNNTDRGQFSNPSRLHPIHAPSKPTSKECIDGNPSSRRRSIGGLRPNNQNSGDSSMNNLRNSTTADSLPSMAKNIQNIVQGDNALKIGTVFTADYDIMQDFVHDGMLAVTR